MGKPTVCFRLPGREFKVIARKQLHYTYLHQICRFVLDNRELSFVQLALTKIEC